MTVLVGLTLALVVCSAPPPSPGLVPVQRGTVKHYSRGIMEEVRDNRTEPGHPGYVRGFVIRKGVDGYISRISCATIGRVFYVSVNGQRVRRYQQVDCSDPTVRKQRDGRYESDADRHRREGLIVELDWPSAVREGITRTGRGRVTVWRLRAETELTSTNRRARIDTRVATHRPCPPGRLLHHSRRARWHAQATVAAHAARAPHNARTRAR